MNTYWAELHNHNEIGYGKGTLDRSYRIARNALDIYAFSPHGYWPDPPSNDPQLVDYHTSAFDRISAAFPRVAEKAHAEYVPGEFVTFIAYEWHTIGWGDYVILFPGDRGELYRAQNLGELEQLVQDCHALMVPHHVAYRHGWRGLDWSKVDAGVSPVVEVFSEHGNSLERHGLWPMLSHSMGGSSASQTVMEQVRQGLHIGFVAGTDDHHGYPASWGEGITAVLADELTRESVFAALRHRHTYACTGDRIGMSVACGEATMGDALPASADRVFDIGVDPLAPLAFVQIIRNGDPVQTWPGPVGRAGEGRYLVRVEWGWGRMDSPAPTTWRIALSVENGQIDEAIPCFAGGAGSVELCNLILEETPTQVSLESFTSRRNTVPVSGLVLRIAGGPDTRLGCSVTSDTEGEAGGCEVTESMGGLLKDDAWEAVLDRFSSPKIRLGRAHPTASLAFEATWEDPDPGKHDLYVIKAQQTNGQIAWTSPILFGG